MGRSCSRTSTSGVESSTNNSRNTNRASGGGVCWFLKLLTRAITVIGLFWILLVGSSEYKVGSTRKLKGTDRVIAGTQKAIHGPSLDRIAYMSKRRVPNGPDPIHNRRAGKNGKPPGQA